MSKTTASGVNLTPVSIKGKDYIPVSMRIAEVNASAMVPRFQILESRFFEFGGLNLCQVSIEIEGKLFKGTASVNIGGRGVDATNPIENAETSALGRALGLAGFGSLESVASAEEVKSAVSRSESGYKAPVMPSIAPVEPSDPVQNQSYREQQAAELRKLRMSITAKAKEINLVGEDFKSWLSGTHKTTWEQMTTGKAELVLADLAAIA